MNGDLNGPSLAHLFSPVQTIAEMNGVYGSEKYPVSLSVLSNSYSVNRFLVFSNCLVSSCSPGSASLYSRAIT